MKFKNVFSKTIFLLSIFFSLLLFFSPSKAFADTIRPYINELLITNQERTKETFSFTNDSRKDVLVTPIIYSYNPQSLEIIEDQGHIFTRADREIFTVKASETLEVEYEVVPAENIQPGTYFNLIVLQKQAEDTFLVERNPIGAINSLSHLVVLHITDPESSIYGITSEFAQIDMFIAQKGIPFLKPTVIKYIYTNNTNYVLNPMGEIQVYSEKGKYPPTYLKINSEQEKLYPLGLTEEEFEIDKFHFSDLYAKRVIIGRFYNGIDENFILKEITLEPSPLLFIAFAITIVVIIIFLKTLFTKTIKAKKNPVQPS